MLGICQQGANLPPLGSHGVTSCSVDAHVFKPHPAGLSLTAPRAHVQGAEVSTCPQSHASASGSWESIPGAHSETREEEGKARVGGRQMA